ncbi:hypothetical protein [Bradyrhizobium sp. URHD0069]|uniref:hypothetical protein n=1 Tax=Bradyrhizobium sp. URHD0069 TaxID=1380355 RepID=UPI00055E9D5C|nr:hypothetical protein [Bradyrhizobium sp. URHD0069]
MNESCRFCATTPNAGEKVCMSTKEARQCGWMGESDWKRWEQANRPKRPQAAIDNLTNHQERCDMDGVMIKVSRQALCEVLDYLAPTQLNRRSNR